MAAAQDRAPPTPAAPVIRHLYDMSMWEKIDLFLFQAVPPEYVEELVIGGFASWPPAEALAAVREGRDMRPPVAKEAWLYNIFARPWAIKMVYRNWTTMRFFLVGWANDPSSGPPGVLRRMRAEQSALAPIFSTDQGYRWLEWTCHNLAVFFHNYASIRPGHGGQVDGKNVEDDPPITEPHGPYPIRDVTPAARK
ncbi:MAG: hypothetical protein ACREB9_00150 [Thermoplasmata archaeon]